jgi:ectoine hydroxylase-related dioxygenase (phytanoyl-CoA dioxygenase family)
MQPLETLRNAFERDGYAVVRGVFDDGWVERLEADFDRIVAQLRASGEDVNARWGGPQMDALDAGDSEVVHTHNVQQYSATWLQALLHEPFLDPCEALLGPDVVLHHTKLFLKPAGTGSPFPLHQDWGYFPTVRDSMLAAVIHVSEATDPMGCLRVVPGSHRLGRLAGTSGQEPSQTLDRYSLDDSVPVEASRGDVLFFHAFTLHASLPNRADRPRKTVLVQLHAGDDVEEEGAMHPNARLVLRGWNHRATRSSANRR